MMMINDDYDDDDDDNKICCTDIVNKLVPCAWLLSGALEVWSLRLQLRLHLYPENV